MVALYLKRLIHKVRAHQKKIAAKSAEKNSHEISNEKKKETGERKKKKKQQPNPENSGCVAYTCFMADSFVCVQYEFRHGSHVRIGIITHINLASMLFFSSLSTLFLLAFVLLSK